MAVPNGFVNAGRLELDISGEPGSDKIQVESLNIAMDTKIDTTYQQEGPLTTSGGGASSPLSAGDIPHGFYVVCSGSDTQGHRWAVGLPSDNQGVVIATNLDQNFMPRNLSFRLQLYADRGENPFAGGASTKVDVWYKPKA
jgi:hypothetical protein